jgi:hypothetical protein
MRAFDGRAVQGLACVTSCTKHQELCCTCSYAANTRELLCTQLLSKLQHTLLHQLQHQQQLCKSTAGAAYLSCVRRALSARCTSGSCSGAMDGCCCMYIRAADALQHQQQHQQTAELSAVRTSSCAVQTHIAAGCSTAAYSSCCSYCSHDHCSAANETQ